MAGLVFLLAFSFLGAGGRLPKARRGRVFIVQFAITSERHGHGERAVEGSGA